MKCRFNGLIRALAVAFVIIGATQVAGWAQGMMGGRGGMMGDMLPPPMDPALLPDPDSEGAQLLKRYCTQCHYLPGPGLHTSAEWPAVVERMDRRMRMMSRGGMMMGRVEAPNRQELAEVSDYLQSHAQKPLNAPLPSEAGSEGGRAFRAICSQCHALPDPGQHTAAEWPAVVERMKDYMGSMGKPVPEDKTLSEIVGLLQRHGRNGK